MFAYFQKIRKNFDTGSAALFLKSAAITATVLAILFLLLFGILFADKNTSAANNRQGGIDVSSVEDYAAVVKVMGNSFKLNFRPVKAAIDSAGEYYDLLCPETRICLLLADKQTELKDDVLRQNVK